jgi:hypothetical protein
MPPALEKFLRVLKQMKKTSTFEFSVQNLQLRDLSLSVQVREPFATMLDFKNHPKECERWDSNPHKLPHYHLKVARLPIPPLPHIRGLDLTEPV